MKDKSLIYFTNFNTGNEELMLNGKKWKKVEKLGIKDSTKHLNNIPVVTIFKLPIIWYVDVST